MVVSSKKTDLQQKILGKTPCRLNSALPLSPHVFLKLTQMPIEGVQQQLSHPCEQLIP